MGGADKIRDLEDETFTQEDYQDVPPDDIVAYNELRSCADLYRMYESGALNISPSFQRQVVWKSPDKTRFIDSLIKQLPIPSLCFSYDYKNEDWQVIDGLQRLSSIVHFLDSNSTGVLSNISDVDPRIANKRVSEFHKRGSELNKLKRRVENATLPITVLRCDPSLEAHSNYIFTIFHRLNTGGLKLNNQEIRNCIYSGPFNDLLKELDESEAWLKLNGLSRPQDDRFKRQEIILRFFAFFDGFSNYKEGLAKFLNNYMRKNRRLGDDAIEKKRELFLSVVHVIDDKLGEKIRKQRPNLSFFEALLVGVARNISKVSRQRATTLEKNLQRLAEHEEFSEARLAEGLSKTVRVLGRLNAGVAIFK